jgi:hypothetical protein
MADQTAVGLLIGLIDTWLINPINLINTFYFWRIYYEYDIYDIAEFVVHFGIGDRGSSGQDVRPDQ